MHFLHIMCRFRLNDSVFCDKIIYICEILLEMGDIMDKQSIISRMNEFLHIATIDLAKWLEKKLCMGIGS